MNAFPLYVVSKGRAQYMITSKTLTEMGVRHFVVVEPREADVYQAAIGKMQLAATVIKMDMEYKQKYELCDGLGLSKSTGPGPARNFAWDHSRTAGHTRHWVMDDNIRAFYRLHRNKKHKVKSRAPFAAMEDFCSRYANASMAGPNYEMFAPRKQRHPPLIFNTRIYSCNLIQNDVPFRWRGRYNEDTILSLDMLTAGWCTIQFNAFLQDKVRNQVLKGGNTGEFYDVEGKHVDGKHYTDTGTLAKSQMQVAVYPNISRLVRRFGRWHHLVDYRRFKKNKLIRKPGVVIPDGPNEYGMVLRHKGSPALSQ